MAAFSMQFLAVKGANGEINPKKSLLVFFDEAGRVTSVTRQFSQDIKAPIIFIFDQDFDGYLERYGLRKSGEHRTPEQRRHDRNARSKAYRQALKQQRKARTTRRVDKTTEQRVCERLQRGERGVVISVEEGVSTSYVGRIKQKLEQAGNHHADTDFAREV